MRIHVSPRKPTKLLPGANLRLALLATSTPLILFYAGALLQFEPSGGGLLAQLYSSEFPATVYGVPLLLSAILFVADLYLAGRCG